MPRVQSVTMLGVTLLILLSASGNSPAQQQPVPGAAPAWSIGKHKAPVVVEVFSDFQCPRCVAFNRDLKRVQAKYGDQVRMVFRELPLTQIHDKASLAAQAAEAAGLQGKFFQMNDLLYAKAGEWKDSPHLEDQFVSYAHDLKLNVKRFRSDMSGARVQERIRLDTERAEL